MSFFGTHVFTRGPLATPENIRTGTVLAEALGYDAICLEDHIAMPKVQQSPYPHTVGGAWPKDQVNFFEMLTTLSYLAGVTQRIKLMTHALVVPYRPPVFTAKALATLDQLSRGRVILAVGVGWNEDEFRLLGHAYFRRRGRVTDEFIQMFKELWTSDDPSFQGEFASVSGIEFYPKPVQRPHPPIWVGGWSDAALRRAATIGDAWFPTGFRRRGTTQAGDAPTPTDFTSSKIPYLRRQLEKVGRPADTLELGFTTDVVFKRDPDSLERTWFVGTPEQVAQDIRQYQQAGVQSFVVTFPCPTHGAVLEAMERFSREVRPLVER
jgi:probable F420-dependent oxidoreductase